MRDKGEWTSEKLLETSGMYWETCTLQAGVRLEVFTKIGDEHLTVEEVARRIGGEARGVAMLLNALAAMGLLIKQANRFANTPESQSFLVKTSPQYVGYMILHHHYLMDAWSQLPLAVKSGKPIREGPRRDGEELESFLMGMYNLAMASAPQLASQIDLRGKTHLLDLGGGPGTYAIHFCLAHPRLRATIFDLPATEPFALRTMKQYGLEERIKFMAGNYLEEDIEGSYDAVWLSQILHAEGPEDCEKIIAKTVSVLTPGSFIFIHDFILEDTCDRPLFPALFSLNMLINTLKGQSYSETQLKEMLDRAGVKNIERLPYQGPNSAGVVWGVV